MEPVVEDEVAAQGARAAQEAEAIRTRAAQRLPMVLDLVIAHVRVELSAVAGDADIPLPTWERS